jgi:signal transduction histidine kinase
MWEDITRKEVQPKLGELEFTYLSGLSLPRLLEEVARIPRNTIVLFLSVARDASGRTFRSPEVAEKVAAAASAPLFAPFPIHFGRGPVGGYMNSFEAVGEQVAAISLRLLSGESPAQVRIGLAPEGRFVADWRQLQRFGLDESKLPAGSDVRFREPSLWESHRILILSACALFVLQSALMLALVLQRRARARAEAETQRRRVELGQASRLALAGELSASIAHEINQPLGAILANAGAAEALLRRSPGATEELRAILADIRSADVRAGEIIRRVRALVTARQAELEPVDINAVVMDVVALLRGEAARREVTVETALEPGLPPVPLDRVQFQQALVNLSINAMEAMSAAPPGKRQLGLRTRAGAEGRVEIAVSDTGPGISDGNLPRIFDSFFTTKAEGTGLGLAITRSIVEAHAGSVHAENLRQGGAQFRILLPVGAPA